MAALGSIVRSEPVNASLGWTLTGLLVLLGAINASLGSLLWAGFAASLAALTIAPPLYCRQWTVMIPWPITALGVCAFAVATLGVQVETAGYVAVATMALVVVTELDAFTSVDMSRRFAVGFAVLTTLAIQGLWIVAQYYSDVFLDTAFVESQVELQWDIVAVTVVGLVLGCVFTWYCERFEHAGSRKRPIVSGSR